MEALPLATLALLGAYHGLNPAMGWLFAIGHELSLAVVVAVVLGVGLLADPQPLHVGAAAGLVGFGIFRFIKPRAHPRWTTMRVSRRELSWWSFLMSSAHGAGLMVAPVLLGSGAASSAHAHAGEIHAGMTNTMSVGQGLIGITVHVGAMLLVMAIVSLVVYEKLGLAFLRRAWINSDQMWATAFILAGVVTFVS